MWGLLSMQRVNDMSAASVVRTVRIARAGELDRLIRAAGGTAGGLLDRLVVAAVRVPLRVRVSITPALFLARTERIHATIGDLTVAGVRMAMVDIRGEEVGFSIWPPPLRVKANRICLEAELTQDALDQWTRTSGVPVRLVLRDGSIRARAGIAGRRLGDADLVVELVNGKLRLQALRVSVLGISSSMALLPPVFLPLPALPRRACLIGVQPLDHSLRVAVDIHSVEERVTPNTIRRTVEQLRQISYRPGQP